MHNQTVDIEAFLRALLSANDEARREALRVLRGERDFEIKQRSGPLLLGMGAAAKYLGVSRATLWRAMQHGTLKKVELFPGSYRVRRDELDRFADEAGVVDGSKNACGVEGRRGRGRPKGSDQKSPADAAEPGDRDHGTPREA